VTFRCDGHFSSS